MEDHLYQYFIIDHAKNPRNAGVLEHANAQTELLNPSCGDMIQLYLIIEGTHVKEVRFQAKGCVISQAAASLLSEQVKGKTRASLELLSAEDMVALLKISLGPTRLRCALLSLEALKMALTNYGKTDA